MSLITIRLHFRKRDGVRLAALLLLAALLFTAYAWADARQPEQGAQISPPERFYYISQDTKYADEALTACAPGYHFASLWEIIDPTNLTYNTSLGETTLDSGSGPPTILGLGWVRTGYNFSDVSATAGHGNCALWTSRSASHSGSVAVLPQLWTVGAQDLGVWDVDTRTCNFKLGVWCVQDALQLQYLPSLVRD